MNLRTSVVIITPEVTSTTARYTRKTIPVVAVVTHWNAKKEGEVNIVQTTKRFSWKEYKN